MEEQKQEISGEDFKPYISADRNLAEITVLSIVLGIILAIVFGVANAYLGLRVGMTVSATIPASVISMGILKGVLKRGTILENNIVQNLAAAAESLAAGVIFTIPALIIWKVNPSILQMFIMSVLGGVLGVLFMIPLRRYLIVQEHGKLLYPEGTACAEVLIAGDKGGSQAYMVFAAIGLGGVYKFLCEGLKLWPPAPSWAIRGINNGFLSFDTLPALLGVGFIIGAQVSALMLAGGLMSWFVLIPLISYIGANFTEPVAPAVTLIKDMNATAIWANYIRYIGAGAVAFGGICSLMKSMPIIVQSFQVGLQEIIKTFKGVKEETLRTSQNIPMIWVVAGSVVITLLITILPYIPGISFLPKIGIIGALLTVIFSFFFATVSSRIVGIVGSSSNPVSGMTIATLLATTLILKAVGWNGEAGNVAALTVGAIVCIAIAIAGDTSQDLKTGFIVGATPKKVQIAQMLGVLASCGFIGFTIILLDKAYTLGSDKLPAPQASLMAIVIKGVMESNLPWILVLTGVFIALVVELLGISSLTFAIGLYLPMSLSTAVMIGGLVSLLMTKMTKDKELLKVKLEKGLLIGSGLIAGDALMGVFLAIPAAAISLEDYILKYIGNTGVQILNIFKHMEVGSAWAGGFHNEISIMLFVGLAAFMYFYSSSGNSEKKES